MKERAMVLTQAAPIVREIARDRDLELGLCLSGGGYRAMLFHAGVLCRLNELGWLKKLDAIASVSGGSLAAGLLGAIWNRITWDDEGIVTNFVDLYLRPLIEFSQRTVDFPSIVYGMAAPWSTAAKEAAKRFRALLGPDANLQSLPSHPRFIFCASNLTTGSVFRFSKRYLADYRLGQHFDPDLDLAIPVAASAAFPPALSPFRLDLRPFKFEMRPVDGRILPPADPSLLRRAVLTDGGVYDNHGLQPLLERCRTLLVSDGGAPWTMETGGLYGWLPQMKRALYTTDNQVRALRRKDLIERFIGSADPALAQLASSSAVRRHFSLRGTYWAIATDPSQYPAAPDDLAQDRWRRLAAIGTWLHFLGERETEDLVNWGYLVSDLALRSYVDPSIKAVTSLPVATGHVCARWQAKAANRLGELLSAA
jgi:predicted acylesterase/phospholipase RssA